MARSLPRQSCREADAVICFQNGYRALAEVKMGDFEEAELAAKRLIALFNGVVEEKAKPTFFDHHPWQCHLSQGRWR
jgi:hypothetical protein